MGCAHHVNSQRKKKNNNVDWDARAVELDEIIQWGKDNSKNSYDCIVTVSGGKDSTRQAFYARDDLGLKPLLVNSAYTPEQYHERGTYNLANLIEHGFDTISMGLNPQIWKKLMLESFLRRGNIFTASELALYAIPIHVAIAYKIPLVFLGENPLYTIGQQAGKVSGGDATGMKYCNTLKGGLPHDLMTDDVSMKDVYYYSYPSDDEIEYAQLRIVYLGYYIEDWSLLNNATFSIDRGLIKRDETPEKIGDYFGVTALDEEFKVVNQMIKYIKHGYGSVTDQMCVAINQGVKNRDEAIEIVKKYDGKCDQHYIDLFCNYVDITHEKFWEVVESYRGLHCWEKDDQGQWKLKGELPKTSKELGKPSQAEVINVSE